MVEKFPMEEEEIFFFISKLKNVGLPQLYATRYIFADCNMQYAAYLHI